MSKPAIAGLFLINNLISSIYFYRRALFNLSLRDESSGEAILSDITDCFEVLRTSCNDG